MRMLCLAVSLGLCVCAAPPAQEQPRPLIATVVQVDVLKPAVTLLDTWGKATELYLGRNARIYRSREKIEEFATIYDLEAGQQVRVSYSGAADSPDRVTITILTRE